MTVGRDVEQDLRGLLRSGRAERDQRELANSGLRIVEHLHQGPPHIADPLHRDAHTIEVTATGEKAPGSP